MAITPNPVTAFRKSGKTPPKPPSLWESEVFGKLYGSSGDKSVKPKTTTVEEEAKLAKGVQTTKSRINLSPNLTPKQKQDLIAEADRIAAGEKTQVALGGPTPQLFKKLQDVAYLNLVIKRLLRLVGIFLCSLKVRLGLVCLVGLLIQLIVLVSLLLKSCLICNLAKRVLLVRLWYELLG
jgi:hypothetical protein